MTRDRRRGDAGVDSVLYWTARDRRDGGGSSHLGVVPRSGPGLGYHFDPTFFRVGPGPNDPGYAALLDRCIGRAFGSGPTMLFDRETGLLSALHVGLPYPVRREPATVRALLALPAEPVQLRHAGAIPPPAACDVTVLCETHFALLVRDGMPHRRLMAGEGWSVLVDERAVFAGFLLDDPIARMHGDTVHHGLRALALDAYVLHCAYEWSDGALDAGRLAALSVLRSALAASPDPRAAAFLELVSWIR